MIGGSRSGSMPSQMRGDLRKATSHGCANCLGSVVPKAMLNLMELEEKSHLHRMAELWSCKNKTKRERFGHTIQCWVENFGMRRQVLGRCNVWMLESFVSRKSAGCSTYFGTADTWESMGDVGQLIHTIESTRACQWKLKRSSFDPVFKSQ